MFLLWLSLGDSDYCVFLVFCCFKPSNRYLTDLFTELVPVDIMNISCRELLHNADELAHSLVLIIKKKLTKKLELNAEMIYWFSAHSEDFFLNLKHLLF